MREDSEERGTGGQKVGSAAERRGAVSQEELGKRKKKMDLNCKVGIREFGLSCIRDCLFSYLRRSVVVR